MWAHGMSATATWWMWALMVLATISLWDLVALVVRMVVIAVLVLMFMALPIPPGTAGFPGGRHPRTAGHGVSPPRLPVPDQTLKLRERRVPRDVSTDTRGSRAEPAAGRAGRPCDHVGTRRIRHPSVIADP